MLTSYRSHVQVLAALLLCQSVSFADLHNGQNGREGQEIAVKARKSEGMILVDVSFTVPATQREAWDVLTDFDHMTQFVSNLQSSKVTDRSGDKILVAQKGKASHGPFSFAFDSVREIALKPIELIRTRLISGSMKKLDGTTQVSAEGAVTRVVYHGESIPNVWVPPIIGLAFIENEVREQYRDMRNEILRRKAEPKQ